MNAPRQELERLDRAFAARSQSRGASARCPNPDDLFEAAAGGLDRERRLRIVDHVAQCAECTEAWRLAMELGARPAGDMQPSAPRGRWPGMDARRFAMAASVIVAVGIAAYVFIPSPETPGYRDAGRSQAPVGSEIHSLPRDRFVLSWSAGPPGSTYSVRLSTADLELLFTTGGLTRPEIVVPARVFEDVPDGAQLLWQVEMVEPSGQRAASQTYTVKLE